MTHTERSRRVCTGMLKRGEIVTARETRKFGAGRRVYIEDRLTGWLNTKANDGESLSRLHCGRD